MAYITAFTTRSSLPMNSYLLEVMDEDFDDVFR
jgi:hypothetical protein